LIISALVLLFVLSITIPSIKNRLNEFVSWHNNKTETGNTIAERYTIFNCALKVFHDNIWLGTGSSNFQQSLNDCYKSKGWNEEHSRISTLIINFLSIGICYGLPWLIGFLACLLLSSEKYWKYKDCIFYVLPLLMFFCSESLLERQDGSIFLRILFYISL